MSLLKKALLFHEIIRDKSSILLIHNTFYYFKLNYLLALMHSCMLCFNEHHVHIVFYFTNDLNFDLIGLRHVQVEVKIGLAALWSYIYWPQCNCDLRTHSCVCLLYLLLIYIFNVMFSMCLCAAFLSFFTWFYWGNILDLLYLII